MGLLPAGSGTAGSTSRVTEVTRFITIAFSGSYTYVSHNADTGGGPPVTTKAIFHGRFKHVPVRFRKPFDSRSGIHIYTPGLGKKGTIAGSFSVSSGGRVDPRFHCDVRRKTYRVRVRVGVSGQQEYYRGTFDGFRGTWYRFVLGTSTNADESDVGLVCPFSPNLGEARIRYPRERRVNSVGVASIGATWYLAHKQNKITSMSYPMSRIYRGQKLRPLDMSATNLSGAELGKPCLASGYACFRRVDVRFRVTPG